MCVNSQKNSSTKATSCNCKNQCVRIEKRGACTCKIKGFICTSLYKCGTGKFPCKNREYVENQPFDDSLSDAFNSKVLIFVCKIFFIVLFHVTSF